MRMFIYIYVCRLGYIYIYIHILETFLLAAWVDLTETVCIGGSRCCEPKFVCAKQATFGAIHNSKGALLLIYILPGGISIAATSSIAGLSWARCQIPNRRFLSGSSEVE